MTAQSRAAQLTQLTEAAKELRGFAITGVTFETPSSSFPSLDDEVAEELKDAVLDIEGVSEVMTYSELWVTCEPDGKDDKAVLKDLNRIRQAVYDLLEEYGALA